MESDFCLQKLCVDARVQEEGKGVAVERSSPQAAAVSLFGVVLFCLR